MAETTHAEYEYDWETCIINDLEWREMLESRKGWRMVSASVSNGLVAPQMLAYVFWERKVETSNGKNIATQILKPKLMGDDSEQGKKLGEQILQEYGVDCGVSIEEYGDRLIYGQEFMRVVPTIFDAGFQAGVESVKAENEELKKQIEEARAAASKCDDIKLDQSLAEIIEDLEQERFRLHCQICESN